jgi:hypothetical protein
MMYRWNFCVLLVATFVAASFFDSSTATSSFAGEKRKRNFEEPDSEEPRAKKPRFDCPHFHFVRKHVCSEANCPDDAAKITYSLAARQTGRVPRVNTIFVMDVSRHDFYQVDGTTESGLPECRTDFTAPTYNCRLGANNESCVFVGYCGSETNAINGHFFSERLPRLCN